jgi:hypothetical protein
VPRRRTNLNILLEDVVELQKNPPLLTLNLFGKVYNIQLILEVAYVIGDQLSQDTHCCRKKINSGGAGWVHRSSCLTSFVNASKIQEKSCCPIPKKVLDSLCATLWEYEEEEKQKTYLLEKSSGTFGCHEEEDSGFDETMISNCTRHFGEGVLTVPCPQCLVKSILWIQ